MILVVLCAIVHAACSRTLLKEFIDIRTGKNEVMIFAGGSMSSKSNNPSNTPSNTSKIRCISCFLPLDSIDDILQRTSYLIRTSGQDPLVLPEVSFPISSKVTFRKHEGTVLLDDGLVFGVSDFRMVGDPKVSKFDGESEVTSAWVEWNHMRALYSVHVDIQGIKVDGQAEVKIKPLLLHLVFSSEDSKGVKAKKLNEPGLVLSAFQMEKVREVSTDLQGLGAVQDSYKKIVRVIEDNVKLIVNSNVKNAIRRSFKKILLRTEQLS